jgi:outer membrane protein OmpA-like peptidoglycan-associated protein
MKSLSPILFVSVFIFAMVIPCIAEGEPVTLQYNETGRYYFVERSNLSRYDNGKYTGLTHRETRASVSCLGRQSEGLAFTGTFFVLEETLRDMTTSARGIDDMKEASFIVKPNGSIAFRKDNGYPTFRDFPVYPSGEIANGDRWQAEGTRIIDPRNDGKQTALPILVEYTFAGAESYQGRDVFRIKAKYATRINQYRRLKPADPELANAIGTHDADIIVSADTGAVIMILDRLDETFSYKDGSTIRFRGSTATFTEIPVPYDRAALMRGIAATTGGSMAESAKAELAKADHSKAEDNENNANTATDDLKGATDTASAANGGTETNAGKGAPLPRASAEIARAAFDAGGDTLDGGTGFIVEDTPLGVRLSVRNIRFLADSDEIVPDEKSRLDTIADSLKGIPGGKFLVEGHTASVGKTEGEKTLSIKRAKKIVDELTKRGLRAEQFIYAGYGGVKPVADNATEAGRTQNRRVEITILE